MVGELKSSLHRIRVSEFFGTASEKKNISVLPLESERGAAAKTALERRQSIANFLEISVPFDEKYMPVGWRDTEGALFRRPLKNAFMRYRTVL